jgi:pimeloyl-ACP methyl ester carboxylesterase
VSTVTVGGRSLHAARRGSGPPLLLLAGMSANHAFWPQELLAALEPHLELVLYDHRGTGASGREREAFSLADLAADAAGALAELDLPRAHVLGFSLGGMVAQELALAHPEAVDRLVLAGTSPGGAGAVPLAEERFAAMREAMAEHDLERALRSAWAANVSAEFAADEVAFGRWAQAAAAHPMAMRTLEHQLAAARGHDAASRLGQLAAPTLVLHGEGDELLPAANGELLAAAVPGARLELLPGAGHFFAWEQPERTAQLVLAHLGVGEAPAAEEGDRA